MSELLDQFGNRMPDTTPPPKKNCATCQWFACQAYTEAIARASTLPGGNPWRFARLEEMPMACVRYDTVIETDRGPLKMGAIVANRLPVQVRSVDQDGRVVWSPVIAWQHLQTDQWISLHFAGGRKRSITVTPDHRLLTPRGMREAATLAVGDDLMAVGPVPSPEQEQLILGTLLGDGNLRRARQTGASLRLKHGMGQEGYLRWKANNLSEFSPTVARVPLSTGRWAFSADTAATLSFIEYGNLCYSDRGQKQVTPEWLSRIGPLGLAVWLMDDGSFAASGRLGGEPKGNPVVHLYASLTVEEQVAVTNFFAELGIVPGWYSPESTKSRPAARNWQMQFRVDAARKLLALVSPYLMAVRGPRGYEKQWVAANLEGASEGLIPVPILSVRSLPARHQAEAAYDVTVASTHTFIAQGIVSANCGGDSWNEKVLTPWQKRRQAERDARGQAGPGLKQFE